MNRNIKNKSKLDLLAQIKYRNY